MRGNWRKSKGMTLTNRGLTTEIEMIWLADTESYRITRRVQPMGNVQETNYDKIFGPSDAVDTFAQLCTEAIEQEYTAPARGNGKVFDLSDADAE